MGSEFSEVLRLFVRQTTLIVNLSASKTEPAHLPLATCILKERLLC